MLGGLPLRWPSEVLGLPGPTGSQRKQFEQRVIDVLGQRRPLVGFEATGISFALINGTRPANPHPLVHGLRNYAPFIRIYRSDRRIGCGSSGTSTR